MIGASLSAFGIEIETFGDSILRVWLPTTLSIVALLSFAIWYTDLVRMVPGPLAFAPVAAVLLLVALSFVALREWSRRDILATNHRLQERRGVPSRMRFAYRLERDAIVVRNGGRTVSHSASSLERFTETAGLFVIRPHPSRDPIVIPKAQLEPERIRRIRDWAGTRIGASVAAPVWSPGSEAAQDPSVGSGAANRISFFWTADDVASQIEHEHRELHTIGRWLVRVVGTWVLLCALFRLLPLFSWALDVDRPPLRFVLDEVLAPSAMWTAIWYGALIGGAAALLLLRPFLRRWTIRDQLKLLSEQPAGRVDIDLDAAEMVWRQDDYREVVAWPFVRAVERRPGYLSVVTRTGVSFAIPTRALCSGQEELLERLATESKAPEQSSTAAHS